ncbi:MAG: L-arabinose isomerase [Candidatus Promineifilaceae bacterium]|nr:L-arabinose isomerase [Candidatus Promineifilaceae bacterium]
MIDLSQFVVWFVTGSQHLYGEEALEQVAQNARHIVEGLSQSGHIPVSVIFKPVVTTSEAIHRLCQEANDDPQCVGLVTWMHTFSPAKMWITGLEALRKPFLHLHTQFNRDLPWDTIDMDFMNLNQAAHGDREFGYIATRLGLERKVVVGHWASDAVQARVGAWTRAACAWHDAQGARIARFGDNMRQVAVTEGDKVAAQRRFGYAVNGYGMGDLVQAVQAAPEDEVQRLVKVYEERYKVAEPLRQGGRQRRSLLEAARIEAGLRRFLKEGGFKAFTDTFENLHGLEQLPGIGVQRLMADGYGFGAEGDWKTAALVRAMKVMAAGLEGGTSFMEDYTYHFGEQRMMVLGAHMLEICESIAAQTPSLEIHPLSIGGKADPVRLVFDTPAGPAVNASIVDLGDRFRMVVNEVDVVEPPRPLPRLPVARAVWKPRPDLTNAAAAWILAGGAHHTGFSQALTVEHLRDFAEMAGVEFLLIDQETTVPAFRKELRWNQAFYGMESGRRRTR